MENKNLNLEIKFIKQALEELKIIAKQQAKDIICLPEKIIIKTDERYVNKIDFEKLRSKINWYAWITPILSAALAFLVGKYIK